MNGQALDNTSIVRVEGTCLFVTNYIWLCGGVHQILDVTTVIPSLKRRKTFIHQNDLR